MAGVDLERLFEVLDRLSGPIQSQEDGAALVVKLRQLAPILLAPLRVERERLVVRLERLRVPARLVVDDREPFPGGDVHLPRPELEQPLRVVPAILLDAHAREAVEGAKIAARLDRVGPAALRAGPDARLTHRADPK